MIKEVYVLDSLMAFVEAMILSDNGEEIRDPFGSPRIEQVSTFVLAGTLTELEKLVKCWLLWNLAVVVVGNMEDDTNCLGVVAKF